MNENMKEIKDQRLLVFIHIPKTGGMTLHQIIKRQYAEDQVCNIRKNAEEEFRGLPEGEKRKIRYLRWHTRFEMPKKMTLLQRFHCRWHTRFQMGKNLPASSDFVTIVRDPVERIISQYYHALTCSDERFYLYRHITENKMSFKDYVESGIRPISDQQTRFLTGREKSSSDDLMIAKANLEKYFRVVGVL